MTALKTNVMRLTSLKKVKQLNIDKKFEAAFRTLSPTQGNGWRSRP